MKTKLLALAFFASFAPQLFGNYSKEIKECPAFWHSSASVHQGRIIWLTENMALSKEESFNNEPCWVTKNGESGKIKLIFALPFEDLINFDPFEKISFNIELFGSTDDPNYTCDSKLGCASIYKEMLVFKELENSSLDVLSSDSDEIKFQKSSTDLMLKLSNTQEDFLEQRKFYLIAKSLNDLLLIPENSKRSFNEVFQESSALIELKYGHESFKKFLEYFKNFHPPNLSLTSNNSNKTLNGIGSIECFEDIFQCTSDDFRDLFFNRMKSFEEEYEIFNLGNRAIYLDSLSETQSKMNQIQIKLESPIFSINQAFGTGSNAIYFESNLELKKFKFQKLNYSILKEE